MNRRQNASWKLNSVVVAMLGVSVLGATACKSNGNTNTNTDHDSGVSMSGDGAVAQDLGTSDLGTSDLGTTMADAAVDASTTSMDSGVDDAGTATDAGASGPGTTCGGAHQVVTTVGSPIVMGTIDGYAANLRKDCSTGTDGASGFGMYFEFVAPTTATYTIDTEGSAFDTVLSVDSVCGPDTLMAITCNDDTPFGGDGGDGGDTTSYVTLSATAGTSYFVWVDTYDTAQTGDFVVNIDLLPPDTDAGVDAGSDAGMDAGVVVVGTDGGT